MKFHTVHGSAISLADGKCTATRSDSHFCNGIVFSDQSIKTGQKVCVQLSCSVNWSGALRIGFTTNDPSKTSTQDLPKYALPYFSKKDGYWFRPISESLAGDGTQLLFYVSSDGHVQFFVDNEHKGALLTGLPTDRALWVIFDIYGNTKSVKFVKSDDAPKEIKARGPEAIQAFESACRSGMKSIYKTRLMLVGQDGAGKTSLKKALLGQKYEATEAETTGIDLSTSCMFRVGSHGNWTVVGQDGQEVVEDSDKQGIMGDTDMLEEEYNQALATNIVQELLYQKRRKPSVSQKNKPTVSRESQRTSSSGVKKLSNKPSSATLSAKFSEIPVEMFREVPERVVELVQKMLDSASDNKSQDSVSVTVRPPEGANMVLNIWDFAGKEVYYTTHQVFLTSRAVYVIVLDLTKDLEQDGTQSESESEELSTLEFMDFWMRSIYAHASSTSKQNSENPIYSPPIFIVGTHRDSLDTDPALCSKAIEEKFAQIQDFLVGKPYVQHLVTPFFAVDTSLEDTKLMDLRQKIEEVSCQESYIGEKMPIRWIRFEQEINKLVSQGSNYASYDQVTEIAGNVGIHDYKEVMTMLQFYHDLGVIVFYGSGKTSIDNLLRNTVILKPQWLADMFKHVMSSSKQPQDKWNLIRDKWTRLEEFGILEEVLLDTLWHEARDQKVVLLGLLEKFDLICQRLPSLSESQAGDYVNNKSYYVPSRLSRYKDTVKLYTVGEQDVTFYIDLHGYLPGGLFQRIMTRTVRWSQDHGGQNPYYIYRHVARFYLDTEHDFVLEMAAKRYSRIKVVILRLSEPENNVENKDEGKMSAPNTEACAKVRNFMESSLSELRELWMKRISYSVCMKCPCERVCETHKHEGCSEESCLHFLNLDECLSNKVVMCTHRRIKTACIKKCFPEPLIIGFNGPVLPPMSLLDSCGNIEKHCPLLPSWVKSAAKLLNNGDAAKDWNALAVELGYKQNQINTFNDDLNPGLALLADWIITSGNTGLSIDMLIVYLEKLDREDIVEIIQRAQEVEQEPPQVFISYQWDCQDEVKLLRDRLERSGFTCWMDVGQLGGGDQLYNKIDQAVRNCKVVIACVSPKFVVSQHCMKELSVADLLCKPIIPVMVEKTIWPPSGGMSLIFSHLLYINMKGVGGHGGTGLHADKNDKYKEIIQRISLFALPDLSQCIETETDIQSKSQYIDTDMSSLIYSDNEDRPSTTSSLTMVTQQNYNMDMHTVPGHTSNRSVEVVHVERCRICTIL